MSITAAFVRQAKNVSCVISISNSMTTLYHGNVTQKMIPFVYDDLLYPATGPFTFACGCGSYRRVITLNTTIGTTQYKIKKLHT